MDEQDLLKVAKEAAVNSYSPYSKFRVGAALLCKDGTVFIGTNVENRSFSLTNCAERSALFSAISQGKRDFSALTVVCPDSDYPVSPCGACRQVLSEFTGPNFPIIYMDKNGTIRRTSMSELLPQDSLHDLAEKHTS